MTRNQIKQIRVSTNCVCTTMNNSVLSLLSFQTYCSNIQITNCYILICDHRCIPSLCYSSDFLIYSKLLLLFSIWHSGFFWFMLLFVSIINKNFVKIFLSLDICSISLSMQILYSFD